MPDTEKRELTRKKIVYYIDEVLVLAASFIGVMISDAVKNRVNGKAAHTGDLYLDPLNLIVSGVLAFISYGIMYTDWRYNEKAKPFILKRIANSLLQGFAWQNIIDMAIG